MKQIFIVIFLFCSINIYSQNSVNSGANSSEQLMYTVGEVFVIPNNVDEASSGTIGSVSRIEFVSCQPLLTIDGIIPTDIYQSGDEITSSGTVSASNNVQFKAGQLIKLDATFTVETNADFSAEIEDCEN